MSFAGGAMPLAAYPSIRKMHTTTLEAHKLENVADLGDVVFDAILKLSSRDQLIASLGLMVSLPALTIALLEAEDQTPQATEAIAQANALAARARSLGQFVKLDPNRQRLTIKRSPILPAMLKPWMKHRVWRRLSGFVNHTSIVLPAPWYWANRPIPST
jgi:hypothetical protein